MAKAEVRCPVCGSTMMLGNGGNTISELKDGIHYLIPETIRNENVSPETKTKVRLDALKAVGVDIDKLNNLLQKDNSFKDIFEENDPILEEIKKGGFIKNPELFRRWITAQTWSLICNNKSWTESVRKRYNINYVFRQTKQELGLQIKLMNKGVKASDKRFYFFSFEDMKDIFWNLASYNYSVKDKEFIALRNAIEASKTRKELLDVISSCNWWFRNSEHYKPRRWLNSFKGAGAYYTLQNLIRTHGLVLPKCNDMNDSLKVVEDVYNSIMSYEPWRRRWDILMSLLVNSVRKTNFELKY